jgi:hypothetical protein
VQAYQMLFLESKVASGTSQVPATLKPKVSG